MSEHYPRIRVYTQNGRRVHTESGYLRIREGLSICFYMQRSTDDVLPRWKVAMEDVPGCGRTGRVGLVRR